MPTLQVFDETSGAGAAPAEALTFAKPRVTVRQIIAERVRQEADSHNRKGSEARMRLVEPTAAEELLNGKPARTVKPVDPDRQCEIALQAFEDRGFLVLVDDLHLDSLDAEVELKPDAKVTFLRLIPLIGG